MKTTSIYLTILFLTFALAAHAQVGNDASQTAGHAAQVTGQASQNAGQASGGFGNSIEAAAPAGMSGSFLWGDMDNDGLKDLFVLNANGNLLFRNVGENGFDDVTAMAFPFGLRYGITGTLGDFNGDTLTDLFLLHDEGFALYRNEGDLFFEDVTDAAGIDPALQANNIRLDDLNGDGFIDLIVNTAQGERIFRNTQGAGFEEVVLALPEQPARTKPDAQPQAGQKFGARKNNPDAPGSEGAADPSSGAADADNPFAGEARQDTEDAIAANPDRERIQPQGMNNNYRGPDGSGSGSGKGAGMLSSPPVEGPTGSASEGANSQSAFTWDGIFLNDNSPGSCGIGVPEVEGGDDDTTSNDIVDGTIAGADLHVPLSMQGPVSGGGTISATNTSLDGRGVYGESPQYGLYGLATGTNTYSYGVCGMAEHANGRGVMGHATSLTGTTRGVYGKVDSDEGRAVWGNAASTTGTTYGVMGTCESPDGMAVYGRAPNLAVYGRTTEDDGIAVKGDSQGGGTGYGVHGETSSVPGAGVYGSGYKYGVQGFATGFYMTQSYGVYGENDDELGCGVYGYATATAGTTEGVYGKTDSFEGTGVYGYATPTVGECKGVSGKSNSPLGYGVVGEAPYVGLNGVATTGAPGISYGVRGEAQDDEGRGVMGYATSTTGYTRGVYGRVDSTSGRGVYGNSTATTGVNYGVFGACASSDGWAGRFEGEANGVYGIADASSGVTYGVRGTAYSSSGYGGYFTGRCSTDVLMIRGGSDLSEKFDIAGSDESAAPEAGMVVCIDPENPGKLVVSSKAYDHTVAGIISGAGGINTGMLMGQDDSEADGDSPVALTGRVYCWVDASFGAVEPGDLLTTSDIPGHAMKVTDHSQSHGAVLGKAMTSLEEGKGLVLVLVSLH